MSISAPIYSQFLQKGESDNYDLYYLENDDKSTKLSETIGSTPAGSTLVTLLKALWTLASKAGVTSIKVGDGQLQVTSYFSLILIKQISILLLVT